MTYPTRNPPRREAQPNLSGLTDHQVRLRAGMIALGERAFGARWQTDLAAALAMELGKRVGPAQVSQWVLGHRPVPEAMYEPMQRVAVRAIRELERRAAELRVDWIEPHPEDAQALGTEAP